MRISRVAASLVLVLAAGAALSAQKQLSLIATIAEPAGTDTAVPEPRAVHVKEDGKEATILKVEPVQRVAKIQILVDNGIGMPAETIGDLRSAVVALIGKLPMVETTLVTTSPQPRFLARPTTDRQQLLDAVSRLAPDSSTGRFTESLAEAIDRISKDKTPDAAYTIITVGTFAGDNNVQDRDLKRIQEGLQRYQPTVHVVLLTRTTGGSGGGVQTDLGQGAARATGGRFETMNVPNRLLTLLPEIGQQVADASGPAAKQVRITLERPGGASGALGQIGLGIDGKVVTAVTLDAAKK